jgi:hypothetical protein
MREHSKVAAAVANPLGYAEKHCLKLMAPSGRLTVDDIDAVFAEVDHDAEAGLSPADVLKRLREFFSGRRKLKARDATQAEASRLMKPGEGLALYEEFINR